MQTKRKHDETQKQTAKTKINQSNNAHVDQGGFGMIVAVADEKEVAGSEQELQRRVDFVLSEAVKSQAHVVGDGREMVDSCANKFN